MVFGLKSLANLFSKDSGLDEITAFQESDPQRQKVYDSMTDEQKKKYIDRKKRTLQYIIKRQYFINVMIKEFDQELTEEEFNNVMIKVSKVYGNTQMIDIFSTEHYINHKHDTEITPLFEKLDECYNVDIQELKKRIIDWLMSKASRKEVRWEIIKGLCHCEYLHYDNIHVLKNLVDSYLEKVRDNKFSNEILESIYTLIIPVGQSMAGQSYWAKWYSLAREFKDFENIQKMLDLGFKVEYKSFGVDEIFINTEQDGFVTFNITQLIKDIDELLDENKGTGDTEILFVREKRMGYKYSMVHKSLLNFSEEDKELYSKNDIRPDKYDVEFFSFIATKEFKNKKVISIINSHLPENSEIKQRLKDNINKIKEFT